MKISIIVPVFNEKNNINKILSLIKKADIFDFDREIIIVDDFSSDGTREIILKIKDRKIKKFFQDKNYGKGSAIRRGIKESSGDIILIQDADLEYDPDDYKFLLEPLLKGYSDVVYGSRFLKKRNKNQSIFFYLGNRFLSFITSLIYFYKITDMETCYKVFKREIITQIPLKSEGFEIEPEITSKLLKRKIKILEVPINYNPRTKKEGKKIKLKDGFISLFSLIKYRFFE